MAAKRSWMIALVIGVAVGLGLARIVGPGATVELEVVEVAHSPDPGKSMFFVPLGNLVNHQEDARRAAEGFIKALDERDVDGLRASAEVFRGLEQQADVGDGYDAMAWLADYLSASAEEQAKRYADPDARRLVDWANVGDWGQLRSFVQQKYALKALGNADELRFKDELIRFGSPMRVSWEQTEKIVDVMDIRPGHRISDLGSGSGYYTWRFSDEVGPEGEVFAIEMNAMHVNHLRQIKSQEKRDNVTVVASDGTKVGQGPLDRVFMCATYQVIYGALRRPEREALMKSVYDALAPDGRLVIVDNAIDSGDERPYRGISIASEAIITQVQSMGFVLVEQHRFTAQRYTLIFGKGA